MKLIRQLLNRNIDEEQGNLKLDEPNLSVSSKELHKLFSGNIYDGVFLRKPGSWQEVINHAKRDQKYILLADLVDDLNDKESDDLTFDIKEVYGYDAKHPMHEFSKEFQAKELDAFFVETSLGVFAVRTEGANYGRYVAYIVQDEDEFEDFYG